VGLVQQARKAMSESEHDKQRDAILGRMLNTPPNPRPMPVEKKTKKKRKRPSPQDYNRAQNVSKLPCQSVENRQLPEGKHLRVLSDFSPLPMPSFPSPNTVNTSVSRHTLCVRPCWLYKHTVCVLSAHFWTDISRKLVLWWSGSYTSACHDNQTQCRRH
jgi:hypothetical protein